MSVPIGALIEGVGVLFIPVEAIWLSCTELATGNRGSGGGGGIDPSDGSGSTAVNDGLGSRAVVGNWL